MNGMLPPELLAILTQTPELEQAYLVGGCVRDWLLGIPIKDYDIEVFGLSYENLAQALTRWGKVDRVGRSFGVVKLTIPNRQTFDFTIPRRDSKIAPGHKGFHVVFDPEISPREAAARRDYTINSLMYDPRENQLLDFFEGEKDLKAGILRHTSSAFPEDPLRVLRGMQFAARFNLIAVPETLALARAIKASHSELARERIREEWLKWAEKSRTPSLGLRFLDGTGWIEHYPELERLKNTPQDPEWHPEGNVFVHTCHCCDALARLPEWQGRDPISRATYMLAVLTHDFGKADTTQESLKRGSMRIISPGHEDASVPLADAFFDRMALPQSMRARVFPLVSNHMAHFQKVSDKAVRRLSRRLQPETIDGLLLVMTADSFGRPPRPPLLPESVKALAAKAEELKVRNAAPEPILLGRDLLRLGMTPGPPVGQILQAAYEAQLAGRFFDYQGALKWLFNQKRGLLSPELRTAIAAALEQNSPSPATPPASSS